MANWLIRNPAGIVTGEPGATARLGTQDLRIRGGFITDIAPHLQPEPDERVIDAQDCVVYPGWVSTHHHLFQSLLKGMPVGIQERLYGWLGAVPYRYLDRFDPERMRLAATVGMAELLLSGTTTCADHHYLYYRGGPRELGDILFEVADSLGMRFILCRGGATRPTDHPGYPQYLPPEPIDAYVADVERLAARYHEPRGDAMRRVVMAPTTPTYSVAPEDLEALASAARRLGLRMHTHLSETEGYVSYCEERHGMTPTDFCAAHGWAGEDVWFAHMVHVAPAEFPRLARERTGIAHCPQSNCRLGSGVAPVPAMAAAGVRISLGVDGAASNEAADMINETHQAWLVHRGHGAQADRTRVEEVVHWGTAGGADILGLDRIGTLAPGKAADLVIYRLDQPRYFGLHDPLIAPVVAGGTPSIQLALVQGRCVVEDDQIPGLDIHDLAQRARQAVMQLAE